MWNALRSDLQEFVSTVTEDTSNVLSKLDAGMAEGDAGENGEDGAQTEGTKSPKHQVNHAELNEIMKLLRDHPGTYTEDLADEDDKEAVEEYLKNFSIEAKTDEIAEVLKDQEDVQKQFEELCPTQVAYEEFWKRYFYRCDEDRIAKQLQEETERARQARAEAIEDGIKSVTNFFGGAVHAVASTIAPEAEAGDTPNSQQAGINFFGAKGRPPFVMNTAVSESGGDEEEEEEELGWDDDDDEDFDDVGDESKDTATEQIEFTDKISEDLQDKLKQAIEERDQIQQTVQMQAEEIKVLQNKLSGAPDQDAGSGQVEELKLKLFEKDAELAALKANVHDNQMDGGENKLEYLTREIGNLAPDQLEQLKTSVFGINEGSGDDSSEKISALDQKIEQLSEILKGKDTALADANDKLSAATKELETGGIGDDSSEKISALEQQIEQLSKALKGKDSALAAANDQLSVATKELETSRSKLSSDRASAHDASEAMKALEEKIQSTQQSLEASQTENAELLKSAEATQEATASQVSALTEDIAATQATVSSLTKQLEEKAEQLKQSEEALQRKDAELAAASTRVPTPPTPDTVSTGVKVDTPAFSTPMQAEKLDLDNEGEGDDWGDDWD